MNNDILEEKFMLDVATIVVNTKLNRIKYEHSLHHLRHNLAGFGHPPKHNTTSVFNSIYNVYMDIDTNIAPLLEYLWLNKISTIHSCENNVPNNYIWICFKTANDLELFLEIVFEGLHSGDNFYDRGFPGWGKQDGWYYTDNARRNKQNKVSISISVRFPQKDYDTVLEKLKSYYEHKNNKRSNTNDNTISDPKFSGNLGSASFALANEIDK